MHIYIVYIYTPLAPGGARAYLNILLSLDLDLDLALALGSSRLPSLGLAALRQANEGSKGIQL